jgi:hypothetical protein
MKDRIQLKRIGAETIYTAKGHFKSADLRRTSIKWTLFICVGLSVISLADFEFIPSKIISAVSLIATILLLMWKQGEEKDFCRNHRKSAEEFLALHKRIRNAYDSKKVSEKDIKELTEEFSSLCRQSDRPPITYWGKFWAKKAIENTNVQDRETDNWFTQ